jgi:hypothetical protein
MATIKSFETFAPLFPGFYGTVFEYDGEGEDIDFYNEENGTDLDYDDFNWNYRDYHERVCKAFVNRLETELKQFLPITIEFQELRSPREYNFANDSINVKVDLNLPELIKLIGDRKEAATQYFKDKYTSCSGFISFHSNDVNDWLDIKYILENPEHRVGALLDCLCAIEIENDDIIYWCDSEYYIDFSPSNELTA